MDIITIIKLFNQFIRLIKEKQIHVKNEAEKRV